MKDAMKVGPRRPFGAQLKARREAAGFTQDELATIAGLSVHAVSAFERGERRRPHPETVRALAAALDLTGDARDTLLGSVGAATHRQIDDAVGTGLPAPMTVLVGRDGDLDTLRQWLADASIRLITLVGPGGVGKTRLALQLAHAIANAGSVRVSFVSLAAVRHSDFVVSAIAEALGIADVTANELAARARDACADLPTLLLLDNFEHLLDAAPLVEELLTSAPSLRVLVTSRAPLQLRGERQYPVGPLPLGTDADAASPEDLAAAPAVRLFVERVWDVHGDFRLTAANGRTVAAICRKLDGLPLALELTAPWLKVLTPEMLLHRLESDLLRSTISRRDLPARQQTMNATVAWSYQLLEADEQRAFRRFGVLPGVFPIDAAAAVLAGADETLDASDDALRAVTRLIDRSLLVRADSAAAPTCPVYYMLETVRAFAALELSASGEHDDAREGMVRYCAGEAALAADGLVGPAQIEWLDRVREDLESYRAALEWLIEEHRGGEAAHIAWSLLWFWIIRGHAIEGLRWYEQILELPSLPPAAEATTLIGAASMCYMQANLEGARSAISRALAAARIAADRQAMVHAEFVLAHLEHNAGNLAAAKERFARSLEGFRAAGSAWGAGHMLTALAWVTLASDDMPAAERLLDEADVVLREAGPHFVALSLYVRGILAVRRGAATDAIAFAREGLVHVRDLQDKFAFVYTTLPLAIAATLKGDDALAARVIGARDAVGDRTGARFVDNSIRDLVESAERTTRERLGPERWAEYYSAGRKTTIDALFHDLANTLRV